MQLVNRPFVTALLLTSIANSSALSISSPLAQFDLDFNPPASPTQGGFQSVVDADNSGSTTTFSATQNGVTLAVTGPNNQDRDRGVAGPISGHPQASLLRDFRFATQSQTLALEISGLKPNTSYQIQMYGLDRQFNANAHAAWFTGTDALLSTDDPAFLTTHQNRNDNASGADFLLTVTSSATGTIELAGRGAGGIPSAAQFAFLNGLEIRQTPLLDNVIRVDADHFGAPQTEPGFESLTLSAAGSTTGSVTSNGVTVTVTTDRTDTPTRDRNNTGESLVDDFIFANDELDITVDGLTVGREYLVTIWSQDTLFNDGDQSQWLLDNEILETNHFNFQNGGNNLAATAFSFYLTPTAPSFTISARDVANRSGDVLFFNGIQIQQVVPEPMTSVMVVVGAAGLLRRRRRTAAV